MYWNPCQVHCLARGGPNSLIRLLVGVTGVVLSIGPATLFAQATGVAPINAGRGRAAPLALLGGPVEDRWRVAQVTDTGYSTAGFLLRSWSSVTSPLGRGLSPRWAIVPPSLATVYNSGLPYSGNDGALWAGRGLNIRAIVGFRAEWGPARLIAAPEVVYSANEAYSAFGVAPGPPAGLSRYANPWMTGPDWIDLPLRFGRRDIRRVHPGQSSLVARIGSAELGAATENEWWGPGVRNALILSDNAPGFPHLFLRTGPPIETRIGAFEGRWLVGGLSESAFFDTNPDNDLRSISLLALTWQPRWERDLTIGAARAVFAPADDWGAVAANSASVFANVAPQTAAADTDKDQLFSFFFRWVFPNDGFEVYAEWARAEQPTSLRDFLLSPNHSQAYTLGFQWVGREVAPWDRAPGRLRARAEVSFLERSTTFRFRPIGTWYTSPRVVQGYTNEGQSLGAAIGPGSSSQFVGIDYLARWWQVGLFGERLRLFEDAHSLDPNPNTTFCNHDVSVLPGIAGAVRTPFGTVSASYTSGWRLNTFFVVRPGTACLDWDGLDIRTNSLAVSFSPLSW